jgi:hypothetical protein
VDEENKSAADKYAKARAGRDFNVFIVGYLII